MEIGHQLRALRIQKGLTQEELAERTDLSKGYISQLENDLSSPSMDTFFDILEVLGCPAADFFDEGPEEALTIYREEDMTMMEDAKHHTTVTWLNPDSNEHEMEPVILEFAVGGAYKTFQPSLAETFGYVLEGSIQVKVGKQVEVVSKGEAFYFEAKAKHQISNAAKTTSKVLVVATDSYL